MKNGIFPTKPGKPIKMKKTEAWNEAYVEAYAKACVEAWEARESDLDKAKDKAWEDYKEAIEKEKNEKD